MTKYAKETNPNIVSRAEFARLQGVGRARISQLAHDGRLVLAENGKDVYVIESLARIEATKDLSKIGTVERHAKAREQKKTQNEIRLQNELNAAQRELSAWFRHSDQLEGGVYLFLQAICEGNEYTDKVLNAIQAKNERALSEVIYCKFPPEYLDCDDDE